MDIIGQNYMIIICLRNDYWRDGPRQISIDDFHIQHRAVQRGKKEW